MSYVVPLSQCSDQSDLLQTRPGKVERVTLAWFSGEEPAVAWQAGERITVVVVWPTRADGTLATERLDHEGGTVMRWILDQDAVDQLLRIAREWPLKRHDLRIEGLKVSPCFHTMRYSEGYALLGREIEGTIRRITGGGDSSVHEQP